MPERKPGQWGFWFCTVLERDGVEEGHPAPRTSWEKGLNTASPHGRSVPDLSFVSLTTQHLQVVMGAMPSSATTVVMVMVAHATFDL